MGNNDNNDLDDELVRSIEKLVEEETNVAKAFVDNSSGGDRSDKTYNIDRNSMLSAQAGHSTAKPHSDSENLGATRMIDPKALEEANAKKTVSPTPSSKSTASAQDTHFAARKSELTKKNDAANKRAVIIAVFVVVAAVIAIIAVAVAVNESSKKGYEYNYTKGLELYESGDYELAKDYFQNAYETSEGRRNVDMMHMLAEIYISDKDYNNAVMVLKSILEYDMTNTEALADLAEIYFEQENGTELNSLIEKYEGNKASSALDSYKVSEPSPSEVPGTLADAVDLTLIAQDDCRIYYTTDGSEPSMQSTLYTEPIKIEKDSVTIKAFAVNAMGVKSNTVTLSYTVSVQAPAAAELSLDSSTASEGTVILITNLEEGSKAYYTVDGTTPTVNSIIYDDGIDLKAGSYVLSIVIINKSNLSSPIMRKNITIEAGKNYTYAEAQSILVARMKELNILNTSGKFSVGGKTPEFVYQSKKTIDGIEMYYIRLDVKEDSSTEGYYGVGVNNGKCYRITGSGSNLAAVEY